MEWLMKPFGLMRNPYDRIAHFAVGWFAFPLAELFFRKGWAKSAGFAAFFAVMSIVAMAGIWELVEWIYAVVEGGDAEYLGGLSPLAISDGKLRLVWSFKLFR